MKFVNTIIPITLLLSNARIGEVRSLNVNLQSINQLRGDDMFESYQDVCPGFDFPKQEEIKQKKGFQKVFGQPNAKVYYESYSYDSAEDEKKNSDDQPSYKQIPQNSLKSIVRKQSKVNPCYQQKRSYPEEPKLCYQPEKEIKENLSYEQESPNQLDYQEKPVIQKEYKPSYQQNQVDPCEIKENPRQEQKACYQKEVPQKVNYACREENKQSQCEFIPDHGFSSRKVYNIR